MKGKRKGKRTALDLTATAAAQARNAPNHPGFPVGGKATNALNARFRETGAAPTSEASFEAQITDALAIIELNAQETVRRELGANYFAAPEREREKRFRDAAPLSENAAPDPTFGKVQAALSLLAGVPQIREWHAAGEDARALARALALLASAHFDDVVLGNYQAKVRTTLGGAAKQEKFRAWIANRDAEIAAKAAALKQGNPHLTKSDVARRLARAPGYYNLPEGEKRRRKLKPGTLVKLIP